MTFTLTLEEFERRALENGIYVRHREGRIELRASDATIEYLKSPRVEVLQPLLCACAQRPYPHELSIHSRLWESKEVKWPWSLRWERGA